VFFVGKQISVVEDIVQIKRLEQDKEPGNEGIE
jgi:hypothetical protein